MSGGHSDELSCQLIVGAGDALRRARALLLQPAPQNLDRAGSALAMAIAQVTDLQKILTASTSGDLAAPLEGLRNEIGAISHLLEHAAAYHVNLLQSMIAASTAEVPQNSAAAPVRRLSLVA